MFRVSFPPLYLTCVDMDLSFYDSIVGIIPAGAGRRPAIATIKATGGNMPFMDPVVPLSIFLTILALAYFALELIFTGLRARLYGALASLIWR